jgi:hypothetical protein
MPIPGIVASGISGSKIATSSFYSIATAAASGGTVTFSSIPSTYKNLQLRFIAQDTYAASQNTQNLGITFNGAGGTAYSWHYLLGRGSSASASGTASTSEIRILCEPSSITAGIYGVGILDIIDYASTSKYKTTRAIAGVDWNSTAGDNAIGLFSGLWQSTAAINSITITAFGGSGIGNSSTFALYGIN